MARRKFVYHGDHLICSQGKVLRKGPFRNQFQSYKYQALQSDCQGCPVKDQCLPPKEKRRQVALSIYYPEFLRAAERNRSQESRREMNRRKSVAEGTFASLDRLGWARTRLRGLAKVDCEGFMVAIAQNVAKAVRRLSPGAEPPGNRGAARINGGRTSRPGSGEIISLAVARSSCQHRRH